MNDLDLLLLAIGDLEFTRRRLLLQIEKLEKELNALRNSQFPTEEPTDA